MKNWLNKKVNIFENTGVVVYQWTDPFNSYEKIVVEFKNNSDVKEIAWLPEVIPDSVRDRMIDFKPNHRYCIATVGAYYFKEVKKELEIE